MRSSRAGVGFESRHFPKPKKNAASLDTLKASKKAASLNLCRDLYSCYFQSEIASSLGFQLGFLPKDLQVGSVIHKFGTRMLLLLEAKEHQGIFDWSRHFIFGKGAIGQVDT
jgi:hypothetical protein